MHFGFTFGHVARLCGHVVDGAAKRISAIERSLRAFDDFDPLEIGLIEVQTFFARDEHPVDEHCRVVLATHVDRRETANDGHG